VIDDETMLVSRIEERGDMVILHPPPGTNYHVIALLAEVQDVSIGDTIEYDPYAVDHGLFAGKVR
jgi:hypothetical protein